MAAATKGSGRFIAVGTAVIIYRYNTYLIKLLIKNLHTDSEPCLLHTRSHAHLLQ